MLSDPTSSSIVTVLEFDIIYRVGRMRSGRHKMPQNKGSSGLLRMGAATSGSSAAALSIEVQPPPTRK